jgi:hypothetical protein
MKIQNPNFKMKNNNIKLKIILVFLIIFIFFGILGLVKTSLAATIQANSCSQEDVQAAINSASDGDTVLVPSGDCTWSSRVSIPDNKKLKIQGAGKTSTIIRGNSFYLGKSGSRISGFNFIDAGTLITQGYGFIIDNCRFEKTGSWGDVIYIYGP